MMPCRRCSATDEQGRLLPVDKDGKKLRGLKQIRKTQRFGTKGDRLYKCQDCGALVHYTFDTATNEYREVMEGGRS
jgi:hypothetical protein